MLFLGRWIFHREITLNFRLFPAISPNTRCGIYFVRILTLGNEETIIKLVIR